MARIPTSTYAEVKAVAAFFGTSAGALIEAAWVEFMDRHRSEIAEDFEEKAAAIRSGDVKGLMTLNGRAIEADVERALQGR